ncbi:helix-turn-helix domain-containing protein [Spirochaeta cellobiosiphila]|uniref:helix-turn-helix domain-containing protein n=1 Tax=Spirochaeta cellobiosiphila TaxID=504483 RepID=UPI0003F5B5BB|nr:response regulator transcription factor [Spirochaeta cellobiosiphila]
MRTKEFQRVFSLIRIALYFTIFFVFLHLLIEGTNSLWSWAIILVVYAILLPVGKTSWPPVSILLLSLVNAALIAAGILFLDNPGGLSFLFLILIMICARLPKHFSLIAYLTIYTFALLPLIMESLQIGDSGFDVIKELPGLIAFTLFAELYWYLMRIMKQKDKLLETLIETQRKYEHETITSEMIGSLSRRDKEVLELIAIGYTNKEIADHLYLTEGTIKNRVSSILRKMNLRDRTQAALRARDLGLL